MEVGKFFLFKNEKEILKKKDEHSWEKVANIEHRHSGANIQ